MAWEFQCPIDECAFSSTGNVEDTVVENAQQHMRDKHGEMQTQDEVEPYVFGPG